MFVKWLILGLNDAKHSVKSIDLLGSSLFIVGYAWGRTQVSQWFDVLKDESVAWPIFETSNLLEQVQFILPDTYRKGFYSFYKNGTLQSHYTTSEKLSLFERAFDKSPQLAAKIRQWTAFGDANWWHHQCC